MHTGYEYGQAIQTIRRGAEDRRVDSQWHPTLYRVAILLEHAEAEINTLLSQVTHCILNMDD
jgi:hypothetical protein